MKYVPFLAAALILSSCAGVKKQDSKGTLARRDEVSNRIPSSVAGGRVPSEVTLTHRLGDSTDCANDSCRYDFFNLTHQYGYGLSVEFGNGENNLGTVQAVGELASIIDLGEISCKDIKNSYQDTGSGYPAASDRQRDPMFWLSYTDAFRSLQDGPSSSEIKPKENHCYLVSKTSSDKQVIVTFHVKQLVSGQRLIIDEIEVFKKAVIRTVR